MNSSDLINSMNAFTQNLNAVSGLLAQADYSKRNWKRTKEMWDMQTSYNSQMVDEARQWQEQMYNKYNSPAAQVQQLKEAGLNPLLMMSGKGSTGGIATNTSTGNAGTPSYNPQNPGFHEYARNANTALQNMYVNHLNTVMTEQQAYLAREQARNMEIKNQYEAIGLQVQIAEALSRKDLNKTTRSYYEKLGEQLGLEISLFQDTYEDRKHSYELQNQYTLAEIGLKGLQAEYQGLLNKWLPAEKQADLALKAAQAYQAWQAGALSKQQAAESVARTLQIEAVTAGQNISNKIAELTSTALIDAINAENSHKAGYYGGVLSSDEIHVPSHIDWNAFKAGATRRDKEFNVLDRQSAYELRTTWSAGAASTSFNRYER